MYRPATALVNVDVLFLDFCLVGELSPAFLTLIRVGSQA